jgi:hypothetical protein
VKNMFARTFLPGGLCKTRVRLEEPVALAHGKTVHAIAQACLKDWPSLRQLGHRGCAVEHYTWDRFGLTALERFFRQWHQLKAPSFVHLADQTPLAVLSLTEFVVVTPCAAHDAQNAFRWAMLPGSQDKDLLRDCYVAVESLRGGMDLVVAHLGEWVALRASFVAELGASEIDHRRCLWQALGVDMETSEVLACELQLAFTDGRLCLAERVSGTAGLVETVTTALLSAWRFVKWSDSRFLTMGTSARAIIVALLTGIEDLVGFIQGSGASMYYLGGLSRVQEPSRRRFLAQAALVSRVAEGVMLELLEDSRVCQQYAVLWRTLSEEMLWLAQLDVRIWEAVAAVLGGCGAEELRSDCIASGHVSFHFFWRRVLEPAGDLPWSLARGEEVEANLRELAAGARPKEPVARQLWQLTRLGFPMTQLVTVVSLLGEIPWTTLPAEQQHGSMAIMRRWHPEVGAQTLASRAFLLQLRRLMPSMSREEKQVHVISKSLQALLRKQPEKAAGRQIYLADLYAHLRDRAWTHSTRDVPSNMRTLLFQSHAKSWARIALADRRDAELRARARARDAHAALREEAETLRQQRDLLADRLSAGQGDARPITMAECALAEEDLVRFNSTMASPAFRAVKRMEALRAAAVEAPMPTGQDMRDAMEREVVYAPPWPAMPAWARAIAAQREAFASTAIVAQLGLGESACWKVVYAVQRPCYVALGRLSVVDDYERNHDAIGPRWHDLSHRVLRFHCNFAEVCSAADVPEVSQAQLFVIPNLVHTGGMEVVSHCHEVPFLRFLSELPEPPRPEAGARQRGRPESGDAKDELVKKHPWLAVLDAKEGFDAHGGPGSSAAEGSQEGIAMDAPDDEADLLSAMRELDLARDALAGSSTDAYDDFKTAVLGGAWLLHTHGIPFDAVQGAARGAFAKDFCARRGVQLAIRFSYNSYGAELCGVMARAWCHKMQFFLNLERRTPAGAAVVITRDHHDEYSEPTEFTRAVLESDCHLVAGRAAQIRGLLQPP